MSIYNTVMKKVGVEKFSKMLPVPSGFQLFDMYNGRRFRAPIQNPNLNGGEETILGGISSMGNNFYITGFTGVGKTTLAVQMSMHETVKWPVGDSMTFHMDNETAFDQTRVSQITGLPQSVVDDYFTTLPPMPVEKIYEMLKAISKTKLEAEKKGELKRVPHPDTGDMVLPPTFFIIDTVAALRSESVMDQDEMGSLLAQGGAQAKFNNSLFAEVPSIGSLANVTVISVNHIRDVIATGPVRPAKKLQWMGTNETTPGGTGVQQYADVWIRLAAGDALKEDETFGFHGAIVKVRMVKSRNAPAGREFEMVYSPATGYSDIWSMLNFMRKEKHLRGAGAHMFVTTADGTDSRKFALRNFEKLWNDDEEFRNIFYTAFWEAASQIVPDYNAEDVYANQEATETDEEYLASDEGKAAAAAASAAKEKGPKKPAKGKSSVVAVAK